MASDDLYELCLPILNDDTLDDDDRTEKLEDLLRSKTHLQGAPLENTILSVLWRKRNGGEVTDQPLRHTIIRKSSPAPWQMNRAPTPVGSPPASSSPAAGHGFPHSRPSFSRQKSAISSPFASPRPSPRLSLAQPIPHSPSLNAYEFSDASPAPDIYGDYGSENVDWLLQDETASNASSTGLSAAAAEWLPQPDMSPYDILRSVLGDKKTDDEIEKALNEHSYDLGATIAALVGTDEAQLTAIPDANVLVGKSMTIPQRPVTPNASKSPIVCKYWLASGSCLRADCRFAHDTSGYLCKYFMQGHCLAGDACQFSHDPALLINGLSISNSQSPGPQFQFQDQFEQFPSLGGPGRASLSPAANGFVPSSQRGRGSGFLPTSRPQSRPSSRHQNRPETPSSLSMDDDSFPTLGSAKRTTKHHGTRSRHGPSTPQHTLEKEHSSLADVVRMSPSPVPTQPRKMEIAGSRKIRTYGGNDSVAARRIPEPQHIPWLETGSKANAQYLKFRAEAIKHGSVRNKFLQRFVALFPMRFLLTLCSAAQAWNRNDARAAKALSLRGQAENEAMRKAHREAAKALYEERNKHLQSGSSSDEELYVDLHGMSPNTTPFHRITNPSQASTRKKQSSTSKRSSYNTKNPPEK